MFNANEQLLKNTFSLDFLEAKLTQKRNEAPRVYKGPGNITQLSDGSLVVKLYHLYESPSERDKDLNASFNGKKHEFGQIIEDNHYFDFEGADLSGHTWVSPRVWVSGDFSFASN